MEVGPCAEREAQVKIKTVALLCVTTEVREAKGFLSSKIRKVRRTGIDCKSWRKQYQYLAFCRLQSKANSIRLPFSN